MSRPNPFVAIGFTSLGIGYLLEAYTSRTRATDAAPAPNGVSGMHRGQLRGGLGRIPTLAETAKRDGVRSVKFYPAGTIHDREKRIRGEIIKASLTPKAITDARLVLSGRCPKVGGGVMWCVKPKDWHGEILTLFRAVVDPNSALAVRYGRDHPDVDQYPSYELLDRVPQEDCDGMIVRLGTLLRAVGYRVRTRIVAPAGKPGDWQHIYLAVAPVPGTVENWQPLDVTEPEKALSSRNAPFWEPGPNIIDPNKLDGPII